MDMPRRHEPHRRAVEPNLQKPTKNACTVATSLEHRVQCLVIENLRVLPVLWLLPNFVHFI